MPGAHTSFLLDVTEREALVHRVGHPLFEFFSPVTGYYHDSEFLAGWAGGAEWPSNSQYEKKPMLLSSMTLARDRSTSHTDTTRVALVSSPWYNQPPLAHSHFYKDIIVFEVGISSETVAYAFDIDSALPQHILIKEIKEVRYHHPHLVAVVKPYTTDFDYLSVLYFDVTTGTGVELSRHFGLETTADVNAQYVMWSGRMVACEHEEFGDQYPAEGCEINPRNHIYYWVIGSNILHQPWNSYTPQWWNTPQSTPPDIETIERSFPRVFDEPASVNPVADYRHPRLGRNHLMFSYVQSGKRFVLLYDLRRLYVDWAVDELQDTSVWNDWTPLYDIASGPEGDARFAWFTVSPGFVNELRLACIEP